MSSDYAVPLKDYLNSINLKQGDLTNDALAMQKYPAFVINKCLMNHIDTVLYANEMNINSHLRNDMQYSFFIHSVRKSKRFSPWDKKDKNSDLALVKKYYGYNTENAVAALRILSKEQLEVIKLKMDTGGRR